jgi:hypothetical protein
MRLQTISSCEPSKKEETKGSLTYQLELEVEVSPESPQSVGFSQALIRLEVVSERVADGTLKFRPRLQAAYPVGRWTSKE